MIREPLVVFDQRSIQYCIGSTGKRWPVATALQELWKWFMQKKNPSTKCIIRTLFCVIKLNRNLMILCLSSIHLRECGAAVATRALNQCPKLHWTLIYSNKIHSNFVHLHISIRLFSPPHLYPQTILTNGKSFSKPIPHFENFAEKKWSKWEETAATTRD